MEALYSGCCQSNRWSSELLPSIATFPLFFSFLTPSSASHMSKRKERERNRRREAQVFRRASNVHVWASVRRWRSLATGGALLQQLLAFHVEKHDEAEGETRDRSLNPATNRRSCLCPKPEPCCFSPKSTHLTCHSTPTATFFKAQRTQLILRPWILQDKGSCFLMLYILNFYPQNY